MGAIVATFSFWQFNRRFTKLQTKQQELEEKEQQRLAEAEAAEEGNDAHEDELNDSPVISLHKKDENDKTKD
ncbi:hypothetical protein D3C85_1681710 [compost metagenome]